VYRFLPLTAYRLPLTAYRLPLTAYRLPLTAYRLPLTAGLLSHFNICNSHAVKLSVGILIGVCVGKKKPA